MLLSTLYLWYLLVLFYLQMNHHWIPTKPKRVSFFNHFPKNFAPMPLLNLLLPSTPFLEGCGQSFIPCYMKTEKRCKKIRSCWIIKSSTSPCRPFAIDRRPDKVPQVLHCVENRRGLQGRHSANDWHIATLDVSTYLLLLVPVVSFVSVPSFISQ